MAAHCRAICLQNPFPNGLLICEKLQGLYIRSSHPPDGPQLSLSFLRLQPLLFHQTQPAGPHTHTSNHQAPTLSLAPGLPAAQYQAEEGHFSLEGADYNSCIYARPLVRTKGRSPQAHHRSAPAPASHT